MCMLIILLVQVVETNSLQINNCVLKTSSLEMSFWIPRSGTFLSTAFDVSCVNTNRGCAGKLQVCI